MKSILFIALNLFIVLQSCRFSQKKPDTLESARNEMLLNYCMPELVDKYWYSTGKTAPLFDGLEGIQLRISTSSEKTLKYFNQGMMLAYGFNHAEAARSFYEAARQDTSCAMCWWGFAYVLGPNYNFGMEPDNLERAYNAARKAKTLSRSGCTEMEKDLIEVMTLRYSNDSKTRQSALDSAYSDGMRGIYKKYPGDPDIAALFAESLMDLHPWDMFRKDGSAQPWTPEIIGVLENGLELAPDHAGLNHFYIHAVEMSQHADKALTSAGKLGALAPGSSHLVHMPSHIYIRTGRYHQGVMANMRAVQVDSTYVESCHASGVYPLMLYPHNYHFLTACATLCGESRHALTGAAKTKSFAYKKLILSPSWSTLQHFYSIPLFVQIKLGRWDDIKEVQEPEKELLYPRTIWHYAQGMADLASRKMRKAQDHLKEMKSLMEDPSLKSLTIFGVNSVYDICSIASETLEGEIAAKKGKFDKAVRLLESAMETEDKLKYQEPPDWFFSVRHNLGAVLAESGKHIEAIEVFQQDLKNFPENGWAIRGLMNSYEKLGDMKNYTDCKNRFDIAWEHADISISSSRIL